MSEFSAPLPPQRLLTRGKLGNVLYDLSVVDVAGDCSVSFRPISALLDLPVCRLPPLYSPDGRLLAMVGEIGMPITVIQSVDLRRVSAINCLDAQFVDFSPKGSFLVTFSRPQKGSSDGTVEPNLRIWNTATGEMLAEISQKSYRKDCLQWTENESYCFRAVSNEVQIFSQIGSRILGRVQHKGLTHFSISPSHENLSVAVFCPESGGKPARVALFRVSTVEERCVVQGPFSTRTAFSATEAKFYWNSQSSSVLVHTHADVDSSNSSYYGATGLFLLSSAGPDEEAKIVPQSKSGPIYDVRWSPCGEKFVVCAGNMPSHSTVYNRSGEGIFECGAAHRNTISWSPHGRFLVIAGFGNLAGEMDFYDTKRMKKMGSNTAHCTVSFGWSPDSRYFLTAVLAPRMNVDNGFRLFKYNGTGPVAEHRQDQLYDVMWQPYPSAVFPNRGPSPKRQQDSENVAEAVTAAPKPKAAPYRPPGSSGAFASLLSKGLSGGSGGSAAPGAVAGKVKPPVEAKVIAKQPNLNRNVVPGMSPQMIQQQQQAAAKQKPKSATSKPVQERASNEVLASSKSVSVTPATAPIPPPLSELSAEDKAKRAKALRKKLKQISELKEKMKTEKLSADSLQEDQRAKLCSEASLEQELKELEM